MVARRGCLALRLVVSVRLVSVYSVGSFVQHLVTFCLVKVFVSFEFITHKFRANIWDRPSSENAVDSATNIDVCFVWGELLLKGFRIFIH